MLRVCSAAQPCARVPPMGHPASPFIGEGEGAGCREREKEREKEKSEGEEGLQGRSVLHLLYAGPVAPVDDDGDGSTSRPCSSLALYAGVVSRSRRSTPFRRAAWSTGTPVRSRTRIRQHSAGTPHIVGDVSPQVWSVVATGHVKTCPLPSWCQKFDPGVVLLHP